MTYATRAFRLRIRNQANSADLLVLSSLATDPKPYATAEPRGSGQSIDPITGHATIGRYVWRFWDKEETPVTTYTITKEIADANARNQMLSNRCIGEYTVNAGGAWLPLHTGYLNAMQLVDAGTFEFTIGDTDRREQDSEVFKYVNDDRANAFFSKVSCIIGGPIPGPTPGVLGGFGFASGTIQDYGFVRFKKIPNPSTIVNNNRLTLELVQGYLRPYYQVQFSTFQEDEKNTINRLAKAWFEYDGTTFRTNAPELSQPWGHFPGLVVEMVPVAGGTTRYTSPIAKEHTKKTVGVGPAAGEIDALVNGSSPRMIVSWDHGAWGTPADNTQFDVLVYAKEISSESPLHITAHPLDILSTLLTQNNIPFNVPSVTATRALIGDTLRLELVVEGPAKLGQWLEEHILGPWGIGIRIKADGEREIFATRAAAPASVATVDIDDLVTEDGRAPDDVIFEVDEKSAINGVDYEFRSFKRWQNPTYVDVRGHQVKVAGDDIDSQTINLLTYRKFTVEGRREVTAVYGERVLKYAIPGQLLHLNTGLNYLSPALVTAYVENAGLVVVDRAGWGIIQGTVRVDPSIPGLPGDYIDLVVPHQVNAKTSQTPKAQRGGTRKVQIVKRTEEIGASILELWDAGNVVQVAPTDDGTSVDPTAITIPTFTLAAQSVAPPTGGPADPLHFATATVTNGATLALLSAAVHFQYLIQSATPAGSDAGLPMGSLPQPDVDSTIDSPEVRPSGQTLWVRAQSRVQATGEASTWSAWTSITLGPALNGAGNEVATPSLSFTIDSAGLVDVLAIVAANVTKVKFKEAAVGAAEATDAAVRAATADSSAPFEALNIFTLLPGEQRAVSAFAYDQYDNESAKATVIVKHVAVPAPVLTYTIDGSGDVDILANVGTTVTSVKFAAASVGAAEATDSAVRAATADSSAPFEALSVFTLAAGEQRAVSAFAYDAGGIESAKFTVMVIRPQTAASTKGGAAFIIDGAGAVIAVGEKPGFVRVPWTGLIVGWDLFGGGGSGSIVVDSWKDTYSNFPPTSGDSIWGTKPTISSATKNQATGLSIAVTEGDILRHKVDSVTTFTEATLNYHFTKS